MGLSFGAYRSKPITQKISSDESNDKLSYGASSMQGWRVSQEDAHNCILNYDTNSSFFSVYDGHGGHEVALYLSQHLPDFLKQLEAYKSGEIKTALEEAFLQIDAKITTPDVIAVLKELSRKEETEEEEEEEESDNNLCEEAATPVEQVIESCGKASTITEAGGSDSSSNLKPEGDRTEALNMTSPDIKLNSPDRSGNRSDECTPCNEVKESPNEVNQNGEVKSSNKLEVVTNLLSSQENGEVTMKDKALTKTKGAKAPIKTKPKRNARNFKKGSEKGSVNKDDKTFEGPNEDVNTTVDNENFEESSAESEEYEETKIRRKRRKQRLNEKAGIDSGSTAVVALLRENELYVANAGDSRCIVCRNGKAIEMSFDHKPKDTPEYERIKKAGGRVDFEGRVNGGLNLSRAIGDHFCKRNKELSDREQMITALPDVKLLTINPSEDEFMVLASDGIWNSMSSQEVVDFIRPSIQEGEKKLSQICEEMFDRCLAPGTLADASGCDNMTAIIVQFKSNVLKRSSTGADESSKRSKPEENSSVSETTAT